MIKILDNSNKTGFFYIQSRREPRDPLERAAAAYLESLNHLWINGINSTIGQVMDVVLNKLNYFNKQFPDLPQLELNWVNPYIDNILPYYYWQLTGFFPLDVFILEPRDDRTYQKLLSGIDH